MSDSDSCESDRASTLVSEAASALGREFIAAFESDVNQTGTGPTENDSIDRWCTSLDWALSVHTSFSDEMSEKPALFAGHLDGGAYAFGRHTFGEDVPGQTVEHVLTPLDAMWLFGAPVVGSDPYKVARQLADLFETTSPDSAFLGGYVEGSPWWNALVEQFAGSWYLGAGPECLRCQADLSKGTDGFLANRSREFRRNLRQATKRADQSGVSFEIGDRLEPAALMLRVHAIESRSWKGLEGSGIESAGMATHYGNVVATLSAKGELRACIARNADGVDIGYVLGGVKQGIYRGLQLSFVEELRPLSVGNLLQWHEVQRLCDSSGQPGHLDVATYDIGMDMPYKRNWTESIMTTRVLLVSRSGHVPS